MVHRCRSIGIKNRPQILFSEVICASSTDTSLDIQVLHRQQRLACLFTSMKIFRKHRSKKKKIPYTSHISLPQIYQKLTEGQTAYMELIPECTFYQIDSKSSAQRGPM